MLESVSADRMCPCLIVGIKGLIAPSQARANKYGATKDPYKTSLGFEVRARSLKKPSGV